MALPRFDPSNSVKFDLGRGTVQLDGAGPRLLIPPEALIDLCKQAGDDSLRDFGRKVGTEIGYRMSNQLGSSINTAGIEGFVEHLGGNLALLGLGSLSLERWGKALVFVVSDSPLGAGGDALLSAILEGALQRAAGRDARAVVLGREDATVRVLIASDGAAKKVSGWLESGVAWADAVARLHEAAGS